MLFLILWRTISVERYSLNPYWPGWKKLPDSNMCTTLARSSLSKTLPSIDRRLIGLYDDGSVGGLLGFIKNTIVPIFHDTGKWAR